MAIHPVTVNPVPGCDRTRNRALGYLIFPGYEKVNAGLAIKRIDAAVYRSALKEQNAVYARFRHWLSGRPARREYHHGWENDPDFSIGYVFRWDHPDLPGDFRTS